MCLRLSSLRKRKRGPDGELVVVDVLRLSSVSAERDWDSVMADPMLLNCNLKVV